MENNLLNETKPSLESLFEDFSHPNPNINQKACFEMKLNWPQESMEKLIENLNHTDIHLRRKSVKALGSFGDIALLPVSKIFLKTNSYIVRVSTMKVLVRIAAIEKYTSIPSCLSEVIRMAIIDENPQIILGLVSLLRQLNKLGLPSLMIISRDNNILRAKAAITALGEIEDSSAFNLLRSLSQDTSLDPLLLESIAFALDVNSSRLKLKGKYK